MDVGLFDLYTSGHHLPHASRVKQALETVSDHDVTFITLSETDQCTDRFDPDGIVYLDSPESPPIEDRQGSFDGIADRKIGEFASGDLIEQYDVIHFLYIDDILGALWRHCRATGDVRLVGELNGVFFHRGTVLRGKYLHPLFLRALQSPVGRAIDLAVPERTAHESLWQDLHLYRCLDERVFDRITVHSEEAREYLSRLAPRGTDTISEIPYPGPEQFGTDVSRDDARDRLDLPPEDPILLFFGGMRPEKGIELLLDALDQYRGPTFTMCFAGPPGDVDERDLEELDRESPVDVVHRLEFIDTPELYYRAADAVVLPYRREYGRERASQLFEEVCSSMRPVIVPDFGVLGRLTREWNLGTTYDQGSPRSLVATLRQFASDGIPFSRERMQEYSSRHTYEQAAAELSEAYTST